MSLSSSSSNRNDSSPFPPKLDPLPTLEKELKDAPSVPDDREEEVPPSDESENKEGSSADNEPREQTQDPTLTAPAPEKGRRKLNWLAIALDTFLVLLVVGVCAGGSWYLHAQWNKYRVPTILELTQAECIQLCERRESLQDAANRADEQLSMRRKLTQLENKLREFSDKNAKLQASIADQKKRVLALQHEIRQSDKESRSVARGLLPGLPIGNVATTRGRTYNNATISRLQGKRISLRTPEGAASLPLSELIKEKLPDIALYALGEIDLVDMTDFTPDGTAPSTPPPTNTKLRRELRPDDSSISTDYESQGTGPVVDTDANKTTIDVGDDSPSAPQQSPNGDIWNAPTGDLPL